MQLRSVFLAAVALVATAAAVAPAQAGGWDRHGRGPHWGGHGHHYNHHRPHYRPHYRPYYAPPRVYYAPPPVYYAPRPYYPQPGVSFGFTFR